MCDAALLCSRAGASTPGQENSREAARPQPIFHTFIKGNQQQHAVSAGNPPAVHGSAFHYPDARRNRRIQTCESFMNQDGDHSSTVPAAVCRKELPFFSQSEMSPRTHLCQ